MIKKGSYVKLISAPSPHKYLEGRVFIQRCDSMIVSPREAIGSDFPIIHCQDTSYELDTNYEVSYYLSRNLHVGNRVKLTSNFTGIPGGSIGTIREVEYRSKPCGVNPSGTSLVMVKFDNAADGSSVPIASIPARLLTKAMRESNPYLLGDTLQIVKAPDEYNWLLGLVVCQMEDSRLVRPANNLSKNFPIVSFDDSRFEVHREEYVGLEWSTEVEREGKVWRLGDRVSRSSYPSKVGNIVYLDSEKAKNGYVSVDWDCERVTSVEHLRNLIDLSGKESSYATSEKESDRIMRGGGQIDYEGLLDSAILSDVNSDTTAVISPGVSPLPIVNSPNRDIISPGANSSLSGSFRIGDRVTIKSGEIEVDDIDGSGRQEFIRPGDVGVVMEGFTIGVGVGSEDALYVRFEHLTLGHDCWRRCEDGKGWAILSVDLELAEAEAKSSTLVPCADSKLEYFDHSPEIPYKSTTMFDSRVVPVELKLGDRVNYLSGTLTIEFPGILVAIDGERLGVCLGAGPERVGDLDGYLVGERSKRRGLWVSRAEVELVARDSAPWFCRGDRVVAKSDFKTGVGLPIPKGSIGTVVGVDPNSINREYVWAVRWDNIKIEDKYKQGCFGPNLDESECSWVSGEKIEKKYNFINQGAELAPAGGWGKPVDISGSLRFACETNWDVDDWGGAIESASQTYRAPSDIALELYREPEENLFAARRKVAVEDSDIDNLSMVEIFKF